MKELERSILCLGKERNIKKLEEVVDKEDPKLLQKLLSSKLGHADAFQVLNYTFMGLSNSGSSQVKRMKLIQHVLATMPEKEMSTSEANKIIGCLSREMIKLSSAHMVRLSQWCVGSIQKTEQKYMAWKELLPNLLNVLNTLDKVEHSGTDMSGTEYRRQVINSLCMTSWHSEIITSLAGMFTDMELSSDEHLQVVYKLCEGIEHLEPASVPPLVHQLLLLSHQQHGLPLFLHLQQYFTRGLYNRIRSGAQESSSEDFISEDIMLGKRHELLRAESTILFYINQSANVGHANVRDLLNSLKSTMTAPELCLNPFFLTVLLSMSFVSCYEDQVFDIIKSAVARVLAEEKRKEHSAWLQDIVSTRCDLDRLISQLIESSGRERELVREGLVKLAFAFLRTGGAHAKEGGGRYVWKYGRLILMRLVRKHNSVVSTVMQLLCNQIIIGPHVAQYVDTLLKLSVGAPLMLSECQTVLKQLIEQLLQLPGAVAQRVVVCVMPLVRTFPTVRDCLMLVLRKAVYSCTLAVRLMAVKGFLLLLKTLDTKSLAIATQSTQSSQSTLSQVHTEPLEGEESVGMEVVGVLRRCVTQQAAVRSALYTGIFEAVSKNRVLFPLVLDLLLDLLKEFYKSDEIVQPPLDFDKIVSVKDMDVTLMEPLAELVFVTQQFVTRRSTDEEMESNKSLKGLKNILDLLCKRMIMCTLENLGFVEGVNLNDILPESRCLNEIYHQALGVYEALIAYTFAAWSLDAKDRHQELISLFRAYTKVLEFGKTSGKPGKSTENKVAQTQKSKSLKKGGEKHGSKVKSSGMKKITTVLDMKSVILMLQALFMDSVEWANDDDIRPIRSRREFCRYVLQVTLQLLQQVRGTKYSDLRFESGLFKQCSNIGSVLFKRFIEMDEDTEIPIEEDAQVTVLAIECWNELLCTMILHFESQLPQFLEDIGGVEFSKGLGEQLQVPIKSIQKRLVASLNEDDADRDPVVKKLPLLFTNLLSQLSMHLPHQNSFATQLFSWLKKFVSDTTVTNVSVVKEILSLFFKLQVSHKVDGALFDNVALQLLSLMDSINEDNPADPVSRFSILTEVTQNVCLQQLCAAIKHMLDDIDWTVARLRGMFAGRAYPSAQTPEEKSEQLCKQERDVCSHMSHCIKVVTILVRISLPEGPAMDAVLRLLVSIYNSVSSLAKYFCNRSSRSDMAFQAARFTHVVHLTAVELAKHVQWLLLHVMADPEEAEQEKKSKKGEKLKLARQLKDSKIVPRIVYGLEMFEKNVILLSKKCNVNLMEHVKVHSGRDFRIKMDVVKTTLEQQEDENESQMEEVRVEAEVEAEPTANDDAEEDSENEQPAEKVQPPRKKKRSS